MHETRGCELPRSKPKACYLFNGHIGELKGVSEIYFSLSCSYRGRGLDGVAHCRSIDVVTEELVAPSGCYFSVLFSVAA